MLVRPLFIVVLVCVAAVSVVGDENLVRKHAICERPLVFKLGQTASTEVWDRCTWSSNGKTLACSSSHRIVFLDVATEQMRFTYKRVSPRFTPSGMFVAQELGLDGSGISAVLVPGGPEHAAILLDLGAGKEQGLPKTRFDYEAAALSVDGRSIFGANASGTLQRIEVDTGRVLPEEELESAFMSTWFALDGTAVRCALGSTALSILRKGPGKDSKKVQLPRGRTDSLICWQLSPNAECMIAVMAANNRATTSQLHLLRLNTANGEPITRSHRLDYVPRQVAIDRFGRIAAVKTNDRIISVVETDAFAELTTIEASPAALNFSFDGAQLAMVDPLGTTTIGCWQGSIEKAAMSPQDAWQALSSNDPQHVTKAYRMLLASGREDNATFLLEKLRSIVADEQKIDGLIEDLDEGEFHARRDAECRLLDIGSPALDALIAKDEETNRPDSRFALQSLRREIARMPVSLRVQRTIFLLAQLDLQRLANVYQRVLNNKSQSHLRAQLDQYFQNPGEAQGERQ